MKRLFTLPLIFICILVGVYISIPLIAKGADNDGFPFCAKFNSATDMEPIDCPNTVTPPPTDAPHPTNTPIPTTVATSAPVATSTPLYGTDVPQPPTWTPSSTPTPMPPVLSPTLDTIPSATPGSSATPFIPAESVCMAGTATNLNVRSGPGTSYSIVGKLTPGDRVTIVSLKIVREFYEEWGQLSNGTWIALWYGGNQLAFLDNSAPCWELPGASSVKAGPHILGGNGAGIVLQAPGDIQIAKCLNFSWDYCRQLKAANPNIFLVARTLTVDGGMFDCPEPWQYSNADPGVWWARVRPYLPDGFDAYEIQNECAPPPQGWDVWAQWNIKLAQLVERDLHAPMLAYSFPPGNPDFPEWSSVVPYLKWVAAHPLSDGRYHGIATHAAAFATWTSLDAPWVSSIWIAGRHRLACAAMKASKGFDCTTWPGLWIITELGISDGYGGGKRSGFTCEQLADAYQETKRQLSLDSYIFGFNWWNLGKLSIWTSDDACWLLMV